VLVGARLAQGIVGPPRWVPQVFGDVQALFHGSDRVRALGIRAVIGSGHGHGQVLGGRGCLPPTSPPRLAPSLSDNVPIGLVAS